MKLAFRLTNVSFNMTCKDSSLTCLAGFSMNIIEELYLSGRFSLVIYEIGAKMDHKVHVKWPKSHLRFEYPLIIKQFNIYSIGRSPILDLDQLTYRNNI